MVLEATGNSMAVSRVVAPLVARVIIANPLQVKAIAQAYGSMPARLPVCRPRITCRTSGRLAPGTERKRSLAARRYPALQAAQERGAFDPTRTALQLPDNERAAISIGTSVSLTGRRKTWPCSIARSHMTQRIISRVAKIT